MYDADPFAARQEVNERQARATVKHENTGARQSGTISDEFSQIPEVKMATPLRELVENAIKKVRTTPLQAKVLTTMLPCHNRRFPCIQKQPTFRLHFLKKIE